MNLAILHSDAQQFISDNLNTNTDKLLFKGSPFPNISIQELVVQIISKKKSEKKLPTWFKTKDIYYPKKIHIEQTSSELTAKYKANLINGESLIDLTGGLGVDSFYFSKKINHVTHCELDPLVSSIAKHNFDKLGSDNITTQLGNGLTILKNSNQTFDCIYVDPSRRNEHKGKVFLLQDCEPNIPQHLELLFEKTNIILLKVSPILDITSTCKELRFVKEIHIVSIHNEVKELLFLLEKEFTNNIHIKTINVTKTKSQLFNFQLNTLYNTIYSLPLKYIYEPNSAIMKSGGFQEICNQFPVFKLHEHSHLYTSEKLIPFPGRKFEVESIFSYSKKNIKNNLSEKKANITTRNFPDSVMQIRKKTGLKDGGNAYLFFTKDKNDQLIVLKTKQLF